MTDREKRDIIVREFERFIQEYDRDIGFATYDKEVLMDALALLKAQEPRVMTLEEVSALPADSGENTPVWMETRIVTEKGVLTYLEASLLWSVEDGWWRRFGPVHSGWEDRKAEAYNITWRCWTEKPTDEQREATAWNG